MIDLSPVVTCRSPVFGITVEDSVRALQKKNFAHITFDEPGRSNLSVEVYKWLTDEQIQHLAQQLSHSTLITKIRSPETSEVSPP